MCRWTYRIRNQIERGEVQRERESRRPHLAERWQETAVRAQTELPRHVYTCDHTNQRARAGSESKWQQVPNASEHEGRERVKKCWALAFELLRPGGTHTDRSKAKAFVQS